MAVIERITAWSFSRWKDYEQCPRKAKRKHIDKIKEPPNKAMERGSAIHKLAEDYLKGLRVQLPPELDRFKKDFAKLKKLKPVVEADWAFDTAWKGVDWYAKDAWCRIKTDAAVLVKTVAQIIDHKTGKEKDDHKDQMSLYGIAGFLKFPKALIVKAKLWYLDQGVEAEHEFNRAQLPALQESWQKKTHNMLIDTRFAPKPGYHCKWCFDSKDNGGTCEF